MSRQAQEHRLETRLLDAAVGLLRKVERRDFYGNLVEFCAAVLESEVCALLVKTDRIDGNPRVCLVAGKLPPGHPKGQRMNPTEVDPDPKNHSYLIGRAEREGSPCYDGVTGKIATTGDTEVANGYENIADLDGHIGKWDNYVWQGCPAEKFRCMLGVAIRNQDNNEIIGVIKVENKTTGPYTEQDKALLKQIGSSLSTSLQELITDQRELCPAIEECEYRVPRSKPGIFEKEKTGEVIIRHSMTAICHSDLYYFQHKKSRERLDQRLPMVLGHETTGEVYQVLGENRYPDETIIQPKDKVVVIPLIPCGTCEICKGTYGENYCPSSRFMASNAPGSLRTVYKYYPRLILKINDKANEKYALFTEPMSNIVQMLQELGFTPGSSLVKLRMARFRSQEFNYFHVSGDSFTNIFNSVTAEEPYPRTLFLLRNPQGTPLKYCNVKHQNLMVKGLGLLGVSDGDIQTEKEIQNPKILILGGGTMGYLLAIVLSVVHQIPSDKIVVTGRDPVKLAKFERLATREPVGAYLLSGGGYDFTKGVTTALECAGSPGEYDIVFECVGWPAVEQNIELGLHILKKGGVLALEGLTDQSVAIDFGKLLEKQLFLKGFYRGSLDAYKESLQYIERYERVRRFLDVLIDQDTEVNGRRGFHRVEDENQLAALFEAAERKKAFGRLVIDDLW